MTPLKRYQAEVNKHLHCSWSVRRKLTKQFRSSLERFTEDFPSPTFEELENAFGSPKAMATILTNEVTPAQISQYRRAQLLRIICVGVLALFFLIITIHTFQGKLNPIIIKDEVFIHP